MKTIQILAISMLSFSLSAQNMEIIKGKIINNYLHYLAKVDGELEMLNEDNFTVLDIPSSYKPFIELEILDSSKQYLLDENIVLYQFLNLGYAYKFEKGKFNFMDYPAYIIEKSGFVMRSGVKTHRGIVGFEKSKVRTLYFSGPLLLHDIGLLTIHRKLDKENIYIYIWIKYFSEGVRNIKISKIHTEEHLIYHASFTLQENDKKCVFFIEDDLTNHIKIEEKENCNW